MTTNKPEVVSVYRTDTGGTDKMVCLSDYEALQAECEKFRSRARAAERECSKALRALEGLERVARVVSDTSDVVCMENNQLRVECDKLRKLVTVCADYLSHNEHTYISHGSVLHSMLIEAAIKETNHDNQ